MSTLCVFIYVYVKVCYASVRNINRQTYLGRNSNNRGSSSSDSTCSLDGIQKILAYKKKKESFSDDFSRKSCKKYFLNHDPELLLPGVLWQRGFEEKYQATSAL